jgi:hypothetical protein
MANRKVTGQSSRDQHATAVGPRDAKTLRTVPQKDPNYRALRDKVTAQFRKTLAYLAK